MKACDKFLTFQKSSLSRKFSELNPVPRANLKFTSSLQLIQDVTSLIQIWICCIQKEPRRMHTAGLQFGGWPLQKKTTIWKWSISEPQTREHIISNIAKALSLTSIWQIETFFDFLEYIYHSKTSKCRRNWKGISREESSTPLRLFKLPT